MKNAHKLFAFLLCFNLFLACTPEELIENKTTAEDVYATGDNSSGEVDDERENNMDDENGD